MDSWVRELRGAHYQHRKTEERAFFDHANRVVDYILDGKAKVLVACAPDDDDVIYGYLVHSQPLFHMLYVKRPLRRQGIARKLMQGLSCRDAVFTQWTKDLGDWILSRFARQVGEDRQGLPKYVYDVTVNPYWYEAPNGTPARDAAQR